MGGGGFSMEPDNPALDHFVIDLARRANPSVCFLATASGDAESYIDSFYTAFRKLPCRPTHVPLFARTPDLETMLLEQDVIYVGGGNTKSLLALWRDWGVAEILREAWQSGIVLTGVSAGAICWFAQGCTDSRPGKLTALDCLGWLPGSACPHYDHEKRRTAVNEMVLSGDFKNGLTFYEVSPDTEALWRNSWARFKAGG